MAAAARQLAGKLPPVSATVLGQLRKLQGALVDSHVRGTELSEGQRHKLDALRTFLMSKMAKERAKAVAKGEGREEMGRQEGTEERREGGMEQVGGMDCAWPVGCARIA